MSDKFLIREFIELSKTNELLTEEDKRLIQQGEVILAGVIQRADAENGNGRIYPRTILEREVENYKKLVREHRAVGELDHPESSVVEMKNISHIVTDVWWEGKEVMGKIRLTKTPSGEIAKGLLESGVKFGISSRGLGSTLQKEGKTYVNEDFQLICFDLVTEPSTHGAFMLKEAKDRMNILTKGDRINRALNDLIARIKV